MKPVNSGIFSSLATGCYSFLGTFQPLSQFYLPDIQKTAFSLQLFMQIYGLELKLMWIINCISATIQTASEILEII